MGWIPAVILSACLSQARAAEPAIPPVGDSGRAHCDLSGSARLPRILFVMEDHCGKPSDEVKGEMASLAAEGRIFAAYEASRGGKRAVYPWDAGVIFSDYGLAKTQRSRIFGIESPFPHGLGWSYLLALGRHKEAVGGICDDAPANRQAFVKFVNYLRTNPYFFKAWKEARSQPGAFSGELGGLAGLVDQSLEAGEDGARACAERFSESDRPLLMRLAAKVNARYVALADQEFLDDMGLSKELFPVPERVQGDDVESQLKMEKALRSLETIIVPLRDRDMADGIADIYCRAADEGRNLVVSLGGGHYDGITARLKKWNPRIPIQVGNSLYRSGPMILKIRSMAAPAFEL